MSLKHKLILDLTNTVSQCPNPIEFMSDLEIFLVPYSYQVLGIPNVSPIPPALANLESLGSKITTLLPSPHYNSLKSFSQISL